MGNVWCERATRFLSGGIPECAYCVCYYRFFLVTTAFLRWILLSLAFTSLSEPPPLEVITPVLLLHNHFVQGAGRDRVFGRRCG